MGFFRLVRGKNALDIETSCAHLRLGHASHVDSGLCSTGGAGGDVGFNRPQPAKLSSREILWVLNFNFNFSERHFIFQLQLELLMFDASRFNAVEGMLG